MAHKILGQPPPQSPTLSAISFSTLPTETVSCIMDTDVKSQPTSNETKRSLMTDSAHMPNSKRRKAHILRSIYYCFGLDNGCGRTCPRSLIAPQYSSCGRRDTISLPISHCSVYPLHILYYMRRRGILPSHPSLLMVFGLPAPIASNRHVYRKWLMTLLTAPSIANSECSDEWYTQASLHRYLYLY